MPTFAPIINKNSKKLATNLIKRYEERHQNQSQTDDNEDFGDKNAGGNMIVRQVNIDLIGGNSAKNENFEDL